MSCNHHSCNNSCNSCFGSNYTPIQVSNCCSDLYYLVASLSAAVASLSAAVITPSYGTFNISSIVNVNQGAAFPFDTTVINSSDVSVNGTTITVATTGVYEVNYTADVLLQYINTSTTTAADTAFAYLGVSVNGAIPTTVTEQGVSLQAIVSSITAGSLLPVTITECVNISNTFQTSLTALSTLNLIAGNTLTTCGPVNFTVERIA